MNNEDRNYVSVGMWMWTMFITAIPIVWAGVAITLVVVIALLGNHAEIMKQIHSVGHKI